MAIEVGTGATVTFVTSGFAANITAVSHSGIERASIQTSHLLTASYHTFIPGDLTDGGELEISFQYDTAHASTNIPPLLGAAETIALDFTGSATSGAQVRGSAFLTSMSYDVPLEELITGQFTMKFAGAVTFATATS